MNDSKWERWSALGGLAFVVLTVASALLPGSPPKASDSSAKIADFISDKGDECAGRPIGGLAFLRLRWAGACGTMRRERRRPRLAIRGGRLVFANAMAGLSGLVNSAVAMRGVAGSEVRNRRRPST
jgi:hypothetical protein